MARKRKFGPREPNGRLRRQARPDIHHHRRLALRQALVGRAADGRPNNPALADDPISLMRARAGLSADLAAAAETYEALFRKRHGRIDPASASACLMEARGGGPAATGEETGRDRQWERRYRRAAALLTGLDGGHGGIKRLIDDAVVYKRLPAWLAARISEQPAPADGDSQRRALLRGLEALRDLFG